MLRRFSRAIISREFRLIPELVDVRQRCRRNSKRKPSQQRPNDAWCFFAIPFDVAEVWGTRGRVRVKGTINGFPFRTNIQPMEGRHLLTFNKQLQAGAKAKPAT